jgi:hypothetical protein
LDNGNSLDEEPLTANELLNIQMVLSNEKPTANIEGVKVGGWHMIGAPGKTTILGDVSRVEGMDVLPESAQMECKNLG